VFSLCEPLYIDNLYSPKYAIGISLYRSVGLNGGTSATKQAYCPKD